MLPSIESNSPMPSSRVAISLQRHSPGKVRIRRRPARNPSSSHAPAVPICDSPRSIRILNVNPALAAQTYSRAFGPRFPPRVRARALGTFAGLVMGWFGRLGRGEAPAFARRAAAMLAVALASSFFGAGAAAARSATVRGIEMSRFGRIVLEFDRETKVQVSDVNGVLVLAFPEAAKIQGERLARELPSYVTQVRHDPDGRGLRVALTQGWRLNVLEAAEKVFIDLLPANWSGLLPALPPEVVDALARRAREAEARAGEEALRRREQRPRDVSLRVATLPTLTRLVLGRSAACRSRSRSRGRPRKCASTPRPPSSLAAPRHRSEPQSAASNPWFRARPLASSWCWRMVRGARVSRGRCLRCRYRETEARDRSGGSRVRTGGSAACRGTDRGAGPSAPGRAGSDQPTCRCVAAAAPGYHGHGLGEHQGHERRARNRVPLPCQDGGGGVRARRRRDGRVSDAKDA